LPRFDLIITTTRHTNRRVRSLVKELAHSFHSATKVNRGKLSLYELVLLARSYAAKRVVIVCRGLYGNPGRLLFLDTTVNRVKFYPLIVALSGVKLAREQGVKVVPPRAKTPVIPRPCTPENRDFSQELAVALNLPYLEVENLQEVSFFYPRALLVEWVGGERTRHVVKFVSTETGEMEGPKLFVKKAVYRELTYEEVSGKSRPESGV